MVRGRDSCPRGWLAGLREELPAPRFLFVLWDGVWHPPLSPGGAGGATREGKPSRGRGCVEEQ